MNETGWFRTSQQSGGTPKNGKQEWKADRGDAGEAVQAGATSGGARPDGRKAKHIRRKPDVARRCKPALSKPARLATGAQRFDREKMHRRGEGLG
jgi:hypothetical protein